MQSTRTDNGASTAQLSTVSNFDCGVCLDTASEPVVTFCGHLFCWSCLYRWMHASEAAALCPICKVPVTEDCIIPLYGRGRTGSNNLRQRGEAATLGPPKDLPGLPPPRPRAVAARPATSGPASPLRSTPAPPSFSAGDDASAGLASAVHGWASTLLSVPAPTPSSPAAVVAQMEPTLSPEQETQAFLSRVLLLLGSFVILCLLMI